MQSTLQVGQNQRWYYGIRRRGNFSWNRCDHHWTGKSYHTHNIVLKHKLCALNNLLDFKNHLSSLIPNVGLSSHPQTTFGDLGEPWTLWLAWLLQFKNFHSMNPIGVNSPWWDELSSKRSPPGILSGLLYNTTRICVRFFRNRCFINVLFAFLFVCLFYLCPGRWPSVAYKRHARTCGHLNKLCWSWILHHNEEL